MTLPTLTDWNTFASAQTSAAAALTGLIFIGVSINVQRIITVPGLPQRAAESILQLFQIFLVAAAMMIPGLPLRMFGVICLVCGLISCLLQCLAIRNSKDLHRKLRRRARHTRVGIVVLCTLPFCITGLGCFANRPGALYWLVPGFFFSYVGGLVGAWVLTVEILR